MEFSILRRKEMVNKILEYQTDTNSAIIYIHDSNNEVFSVPKNEKQFLKAFINKYYKYDSRNEFCKDIDI